MTRNELIAIGNEIERAVVSIDRSPMLALMHARTAHEMLGLMLAPHEAGIVVKDIRAAELVNGLDPHDVTVATMNALSGLGNGKINSPEKDTADKDTISLESQKP